jgi:hypothetical protein
MIEFVCIDCHKPGTSIQRAKRCKDCRRLHHNRCNALRMAAKRADPAFHEAERDAPKLRMRRYRADRPAKPRASLIDRAQRRAAKLGKRFLMPRTPQGIAP